MLQNTIANISAFTIFSLASATHLVSPIAPDHILASHQFSLDNRYGYSAPRNVMKDNILLNLAYMDGRVKSASDINWDQLEKPAHYQFKLLPAQTFAFHDSLLPEYVGRVDKTGNAHFNSTEGFKYDGYMVGDGVCHLASLIYWTALDAKLDAKAPTNHNFMPIPEINRKYGVSIYSNPFGPGDARQNLYITNNKAKPVIFNFDYIDSELTVSIVEVN